MFRNKCPYILHQGRTAICISTQLILLNAVRVFICTVVLKRDYRSNQVEK
jgi:hypothetical protein